MSKLNELHAKAAARRAEQHLAYGGTVTPEEAYELLRADQTARLVDVRTRAELDWVGRPEVPAGQYVHLEWSHYPGGTQNPEFIAELKHVAASETPLLLLCRSAARSKLAARAAAQAGFTRAYDVLAGFEGDKDASGHRRSVGGWCYHGLPWVGA